MPAIFIAPILAWAKHAVVGLTLEQIKAELLNGRDLSKKGSHKRQIESNMLGERLKRPFVTCDLILGARC
jgi:hypothetical protein